MFKAQAYRIAFSRVGAACALIFAMGIFTLQAHAADTWVEGRFYIANSESPDTVARGDFAASFKDVLPWGSRVELHYGFGYEIPSAEACCGYLMIWQDVGTVEATAVAPYTWTAWVDQTLNKRRDAPWYSKLQYYWIITLPDGYRYAERGGLTPSGYFQAFLPSPEEVLDVDRTQARFERLYVVAVDRL